MCNMCRKSHMHMLNHLTNSTCRKKCIYKGYIESQCEKKILKRSTIPEKYIVEDPTVTVKLKTAKKHCSLTLYLKVSHPH